MFKRFRESPAFTVLWLALTVGVLHLLVMLVVEEVLELEPTFYYHAILDIVVMAIPVSPVLYMYIIRRKRAEEGLKKHRDPLEELVAERTTELQEMALFAQLNPAPLLRFDDRGIILLANPAAVAILGRGSQERRATGVAPTRHSRH